MSSAASVIDEIKTRVKIEELIGKSFQVTGRGRVLTTLEHDSLKIWVEEGRWWWFSRGQGGDVLDWQRLIARCDLPQAIQELAREAGVELRPPTAEEVEVRSAAARRQAVLALAARWFGAQMQGPAGRSAREYCAGRGWTAETIRREGVGYNPDSRADAPVTAVTSNEHSGTTDKNDLADDEMPPLSAVLREAGLLDEPAAKAALSMPPGMIVYVHRLHGAPAYLSGRSINGKRHYNMPAELAGERLPYANEPASIEGRRAEHVRVLVEGQADAIALGQLGIPATALCGVQSGAVTAVTHVGLDNDDAGQAKAIETALSIDPLVKVIAWPESIKAEAGHNHVRVKDAADLVRGQATAEDVLRLLDGAESALMALARSAGRAKGDERKRLLDQFFRSHAALEPVVATDMRPELARELCGGSISQFNRLLKAFQREQEARGEEKASPQRYEATAGFAKGGWVFEQCVVSQPDGFTRVSFAVRSPDGKIDQRQFVEIGDVAYVPFSGDTKIIAKGVVNFPEKPLIYGTVKALVEEVRGFIHKYLDIDPFYERLAAYYVLFTWMYDAFENLPYLRAIGDYGTGKTRFIQAIGAVCYRPMFVSGAATVSPVFRLLDAFRGTLVIDEADFSNSEAENEIIKILNVGYYRGGVVLRSEKDPESDVYFPSVNEVYGPKILATRKIFGDRATESRCLTKHMTARRPRPGIPYTLDGDFWAEATQIRNKLLMYRLQNHRPIKLDQSLADESVEPRLNQVTLALKSVVDDPEMRQEIDQFIRAYNEVLIQDRQMTTPAMVVQALAQIHWSRNTNLMGEDERDFSMKGICAVAKGIADEIDPEIKWSAKRVGQILSEELGLTKRRQHPRRRRSEVVFDEDELLALMRRYGIQVPGADGQEGTTEGTESAAAE